MRDGTRQVDMSHALAAHLRLGYFNATLLTNDPAVLQSLVFPAETFVILDRTEDFGTEEAIALRFKGTVVDGLRLLHLTE